MYIVIISVINSLLDRKREAENILRIYSLFQGRKARSMSAVIEFLPFQERNISALDRYKKLTLEIILTNP